MKTHPTRLTEDALLEQCDIQRTKRGGPGGQHRNKTDSTIVITHRESGLRVEASERRSQHDNRRVALQRMRLELARNYRVEALPTPSEQWRSRTKNRKLSVSVSHEDFPILLAELLDQLNNNDGDLNQAAEFFEVTISQLVKLLKSDPETFGKINADRQQKGLHKLK